MILTKEKVLVVRCGFVGCMYVCMYVLFVVCSVLLSIYTVWCTGTSIHYRYLKILLSEMRDASVFTLLFLIQTPVPNLPLKLPHLPITRISIIIQYRQRDSSIYHTAGTDRAPICRTGDREYSLDERSDAHKSVHNKKRTCTLEYRTSVTSVSLAFFTEHIVGSV